MNNELTIREAPSQPDWCPTHEDCLFLADLSIAAPRVAQLPTRDYVHQDVLTRVSLRETIMCIVSIPLLLIFIASWCCCCCVWGMAESIVRQVIKLIR